MLGRMGVGLGRSVRTCPDPGIGVATGLARVESSAPRFLLCGTKRATTAPTAMAARTTIAMIPARLAMADFRGNG